MQPSVTVVEGPGRGLVYQVKRDRVTIGRDAGCDISLNDMLISRHHAEIVSNGDHWDIVDLKSSNGTRINGEEVTRRRLYDGDTVLLGKTLLRFGGVSDSSVTASARHAASMSETQMITIDSRGLLARWADEAEDEAGLKRAKHDLEILYRASRRLSTILESTQLVLRALDIIFEEIKHVDRCSIHLLDESTGHLECSASRCGPSIQLRDAPNFSKRMMDQVLTEKRAVLTYDALRDARFKNAESIAGSNIHSAICAPLQSQNAILGIIHTDTLDPSHKFTRDDLRLIAAIGLLAGTAFENARLYERVAADRAALDLANRELRAAQEKLVQSEKLAAVGQMASGIVHDIKNPMTVMLGYTELIKDRLDQIGSDGKIAEYVKEVEKGVHYCNEVISSLLKFAKPSKLTKSEVGVNDLVSGTLKFLQVELRKASIRLDTEFDERVPNLMIDENQIKQVFVNIILNAIQAMDKREPVLTVATEMHEDARHAWWIHIIFRDNGKGMTEDQRRRVFDPFYTTKTPGAGAGGTGLGLSVSYNIVNSHGGSIEVRSTPGEGSAFTVILPVAAVSSATRIAV